MKRLIIVLCLILATLSSVESAQKKVIIAAEAWYHEQISDIEPMVLFTTDHAGFYRFTSMMQLNSPTSGGASVSASSDVFSQSLGSAAGYDVGFCIFAVYLDNNVVVTIWVNSPDYGLFTSYDFFLTVEEFKE